LDYAWSKHANAGWGSAWSFLQSATSGPNGLFQVIDTQPEPPPARYCRTVYP
jgi:hypothetical protein